MVENTNPKKQQINVKATLNKLIVDKTRVDEFEELSALLRQSRQFKISDFWRCQRNVPLMTLTISKANNELIGWVLYLVDIGEVYHKMADVHYRGIISSSKNIIDKTPFVSIVNTSDCNTFIISLGGYASLIKPKIY